MYSLPKLNNKQETLQNLQIRKLLPDCVCSDTEMSNLDKQLYETTQSFVGACIDKPKFLAGQTKKDLNKINKKLIQIRDIMKENPMLLRYIELKSNAIENTGLDISIANINNFNSFFGGIKTMCKICEFHCKKFGNTGGRYKNNALSNKDAQTIFIYELKHIYEQATNKTASGNYPQGGIVKDTPFITFAKDVLKIINNELETLNNGHGIHFSIYDIMRKIKK